MTDKTFTPPTISDDLRALAHQMRTMAIRLCNCGDLESQRHSLELATMAQQAEAMAKAMNGDTR